MIDKTVVNPQSVDHEIRHSPPWGALPVMLVGTLLFATDAFIVNVALPTIGKSLHAGPAFLELTIAGYIASYSCLLVIGGRLGDMYGHRKLFMIGMAGFVLTSATCGLAPTIEVLVASRIVQGLAAAMMVPQVLAVIQTFFHGQDRQRALGIFGAVLGSATVVGQVLGGAIVAADIGGLSWRPAFLINIPIGLAGLLLAYRFVPETRAQRVPQLDLPGAALLALAVVLVLLPVSCGRDAGWPWWCWASFVAAVPAWIMFVTSQKRAERTGRIPLLVPSLLRYPGMRRGLGFAFGYFLGVGGFMITIAMSLQSGLGMGPLLAGLTMVPYALGFFCGSFLARRLVTRHGRHVITGGMVTLILGLLGIAIEAVTRYPELSAADLGIPLALIGLGQACVVVPLFGVVLRDIPTDLAGLASGVLTTTQQIGMALGTAFLGTLLFAVVGTSAGHPQWGPATAAACAAEALLTLITLIGSRHLSTPRT